MQSKFNLPSKFSNTAETKNFHITDEFPLTQAIINYEALDYRQRVIQFQDVRISTNWQMKKHRLEH
jgi:hypothetical protein